MDLKDFKLLLRQLKFHMKQFIVSYTPISLQVAGSINIFVIKIRNITKEIMNINAEAYLLIVS